ncbi:MAG: HNH endonuclease [Anaerolineae bacterium]|nr:HNH endonuclease [Anaerolineae bacterium]
MNKARYNEYIKSDVWRQVAGAAIERAGRRCQRCGATHDLSVHHLTYERLGHELPSDLEVLCSVCHNKADIIRESKARSRQDQARFEAWAEKVYGYDWYMREFEARERFDELHGSESSEYDEDDEEEDYDEDDIRLFWCR